MFGLDFESKFEYFKSTCESPQVVTTLKNTAKPVTEVPFPAVTICSSGLNMDAVKKALMVDFAAWMVEDGRTSVNKEEDKEMSSWRDRCLHLDFVARIAQKLFTALTERFFRKYSPRSDLDHMMINLMNPAQDWADEDLPGDADGDPCH